MAVENLGAGLVEITQAHEEILRTSPGEMPVASRTRHSLFWPRQSPLAVCGSGHLLRQWLQNAGAPAVQLRLPPKAQQPQDKDTNNI